MSQEWKEMLTSFDDRRDLIIPGNAEQTIRFCAEHLIKVGSQAISERGFFTLALSGGSTPKPIYKLLTSKDYRSRLDWKKVKLFWSDERCVPPTHPESNYHLAMEMGFSTLGIPEKNIFRMPAENPDLMEAAKDYEVQILENVPDGVFDLITLGMGEDGHTASLFPKTHGLHPNNQLVIANFVPQKNMWRMTLTFECINQAHEIAIYVIGKSKASTLKEILNSHYDPDTYPIQAVGTRTHKALWIVDNEGAKDLLSARS